MKLNSWKEQCDSRRYKIQRKHKKYLSLHQSVVASMEIFYIFTILCERLTPTVYNRLLTQNIFVHLSQEGFNFRVVVNNSGIVKVSVSNLRTEILRRTFNGEHLCRIWSQRQREGHPLYLHYGLTFGPCFGYEKLSGLVANDTMLRDWVEGDC